MNSGGRKERSNRPVLARKIIFTIIVSSFLLPAITGSSYAQSSASQLEILTTLIQPSDENTSLKAVWEGRPILIRNIVRNSEPAIELFTYVVQVSDNTGVVLALLVQENVEIPRFRIAEVATEESIILENEGEYMAKVLVIDHLDSPSVFAYSEKPITVFDPEKEREPKGGGHGFNVRIDAQGPLQWHQLPASDEGSGGVPFRFEVDGFGVCTDEGDISVGYRSFEPPYPDIDFSYETRDPDLEYSVNRIQNLIIRISEDVIIVKGDVVSVYDAPRSGIFYLTFSKFYAFIEPTAPIDCFDMKTSYSARTTSLFQVDFTHELSADPDGIPMMDQIERWGTAHQSVPNAAVGEQYKFDFDI